MKNGAGIILSAPSSNSGKTIITLGLLRALSREGFKIKSAKSGPDYIDTRFHAAASRSECYNLDTWAMHSNQISNLVNSPSPLIVEGAMGLFDGAPPNGEGSTAHLAKILDLPVILILDVTSQAQSVAAVVLGFMKLDPDIKISGLILNKVGSDKHNRMLISALEPLGIPILGSIYRQT
ncbi:AAA family ATPase, partial [Amylibacter sp.]|nr:AAA family ATPase [Amylibacter sp.]